MIIQILFVVSAVLSIFASFKMIGVMLGNSVTMPVPILHLFNLGASNVYIMTFAYGFQIWFWSQPMFI